MGGMVRYGVLVVLVLLGCASAQVKILEPQGLKGRLDHELSTFGMVDYQATVTIEVFLWGNQEGCDYPDDRILSLKSTYPKAFLMKRGKCPYREQSSNAHKAGARLVIVYRDDNQDIHNNTPVGKDDSKDFELPPVMIISNKDGENMKSALLAGNKVIISSDFEIKKHEPPVKVRFVYSSIDSVSLEILSELLSLNGGDGQKKGASVPRLGKTLMKLLAVPKVIMDSEAGYSEKEIKKYCLPNSNFCSPKPSPSSNIKNPWEEVFLGAALFCFTKNIDHGDIKKNLVTFLDVLQDLSQALLLNKESYIPFPWEEREGDIMKVAEGCLKEAVGDDFSNLRPRSKFFEEMRGMGQQNILKLPSLYIEEELVRGELTPITAKSAFCDSLHEYAKPTECKDLAKYFEQEMKDVLDKTPPVRTMGTFGTILSILILTAIAFGIIYLGSKVVIKSRAEKDIRRDIDASLEKYYQIQNTKLPVIASSDTELTPNNA